MEICEKCGGEFDYPAEGGQPSQGNTKVSSFVEFVSTTRNTQMNNNG